MVSRFDLNGVPLVKRRFAAFLKDDQGRTYTCCDVASFGRSHSTVHSIVGQFRRRE
jgi:hypothetical protein